MKNWKNWTSNFIILITQKLNYFPNSANKTLNYASMFYLRGEKNYFQKGEGMIIEKIHTPDK